MASRRVNRNMFGLAFTAGAAAIFLIVTGVIGWQPPPNLNPAASTWRRGVWTDEIIWPQVALGIVFLLVAGFAVNRVNRRLSKAR
jgi:uncharacterized membrane protein